MNRFHKSMALALILVIMAPGLVWADEEEIEPDPLATVPEWLAGLWQQVVEKIIELSGRSMPATST